MRSAIAAEGRYCGGRERIRPTRAGLANRCRIALTAVSADARAFARALVFLRAPSDLEPLLADTIDAAHPIVDLVRLHPAGDCLSGKTPASRRYADAGRDLLEVIAAFERVLDRWDTEVSAGP